MTKPAAQLLPYQLRVVDEKDELDRRRSRLLAFMASPACNSVDDAEKARLFRQALLMQELSMVLGERIAAFR